MSGFFSLPRSFTRDPLWVDLNPKVQSVFLIILDRVCFETQKFDDHGKIIELSPGEVCSTIREILNWSSKHLSKNDIERSLVKLKVCGFLRQEVRHTKSVITITDSRIMELIVKRFETGSETTLRQDRDKIETQKKNAKNAKKAKTEEKDKKEDLPKTKFREFVQLTQTEHDNLLVQYGLPKLTSMLDILDAYKGSNGKEYKSDFHVMKPGGWLDERATEKATPKPAMATSAKDSLTHGKIYETPRGNFECLKDENGVGFLVGTTFQGVNYRESGWKEKLGAIMQKLGISL